MKPFKIYENFRKMTRKNSSNIYEVTKMLSFVSYTACRDVIEGVMIYLCIVWELIIEVIGDISAQTKGCGRRSRLHE